MIRKNMNKLSVENLEERIKALEEKVEELTGKSKGSGKKQEKKKPSKKEMDENDF